MNIAGRLRAIIGAMPGSESQRQLLRLADAARDRKQYQDAAKLYDQALRSAAPNVDILLLLQCGHMHKEGGNLPEAEARYLRALSLEPKNAEVLLQLGHFYKVAGRYAEAKQYYREALVVRPGLSDAEDELHRLEISAELRLENGRRERNDSAGGPTQKEPGELDRRLHRELLRLADDARDRKQYLVAAELYDRALRAVAPNVDILLLLQCGHMHKDARNFGEAKARYLQALSLEPKNAEVLMQLGHFYKVVGRYADAEHYYQEALIARPEWADPEDELHHLRESVELRLEKARLERPDRVGRLAREEPDEFDGRIDPELFAKTRDELYVSHQAAVVGSDGVIPPLAISAIDVISGIEMILGRTPDKALVDYHLGLGFSNRAELGKYLIGTDEFKNKFLGIEPPSNIWEQKARQAAERKERLKSFGPSACGLLVDTIYGLFAVDPEDASVTNALLQHGRYAENELAAFKELITDDSNILVVGCHIGAHVVPLAKRCKMLVGVEANPNTFKFLKANIQLNECNNVTLYNIAANDKEEMIDFMLNRDNSGGSKRIPHHHNIPYAYDNPEIVKVHAFRLDDTLGDAHFDLIIMDIEGSEYFALRGMPNQLARARVLAVEFLPHHIRDVANVGINQFIDTIMPHFNQMFVEGKDAIISKGNIKPTLVKMFDANEGHDLIFFIK